MPRKNSASVSAAVTPKFYGIFLAKDPPVSRWVARLVPFRLFEVETRWPQGSFDSREAFFYFMPPSTAVGLGAGGRECAEFLRPPLQPDPARADQVSRRFVLRPRRRRGEVGAARTRRCCDAIGAKDEWRRQEEWDVEAQMAFESARRQR